MVTVGGIITGGFALLRNRPFSALVWGILYVGVAALGIFALFVPFMQFVMANAGRQAAPDPTMFLQFIGQIYLFYFLLMLVLVVVLTAGLRAALRPEESSFASLRLGMDELRMVGLTLLFAIAAFFLMMVIMMLMVVVVGATGGMAALAPGSGGQFSVGMLLMMLVMYAVPIYFGVRLSPAFALTVMRRKIIIGEAWTISRGNFWVMFAGYLVLNLIIMAVYIALIYLVMLPLVAVTVGSNPAAAMAVMQGHIGGGIAAAALLFCLVFAVLSGVGIAFICGGVAAATRSLTGDSDVNLAETFA